RRSARAPDPTMTPALRRRAAQPGLELGDRARQLLVAVHARVAVVEIVERTDLPLLELLQVGERVSPARFRGERQEALLCLARRRAHQLEGRVERQGRLALEVLGVNEVRRTLTHRGATRGRDRNFVEDLCAALAHRSNQE